VSRLPRSLLWRPDELARGLDWLVGFDPVLKGEPPPPARVGTIEEALISTLSAMDIEPTPLASRVEDTARCIASSTPMVLPFSGGETAVLVVRANRRAATLISGDGSHHRVPMPDILAELEVPPSDEVATTIRRLERDVSPAVARAFRREHQSHQRGLVGWQVPGAQTEQRAAFWNRSTIARVVGLVGLHAVHFGLWVLSWITLVSALLSVGDRDALLLFWMVTLVSSLVLLPVESLLQQNLATRLGVAIKQGLLGSALRLDEAAVREQGIGQLTAQSLEANRLDTLTTQGGLRVLLSAFDALSILVLFIWYAGLHPLLLLFLLAILLAARWWVAYYRAEERLLAAHLRLTAVQTEEMIGHRTRKVFVGRSRWHMQEDSCLMAYEQACSEANRAELGIGAVPRLWAVCGVAIILIELFGQTTSTAVSVALIGFVIVGFGILHSASSGIMKLLRALVSSRFLDQVNQDQPVVAPRANLSPGAESGTQLIVQGLGYAYTDSARQVLRDVNLKLDGFDKVLLTGSSGSGKSTLGALLAGRLQPTSGSILSQSVDRFVTGINGWRQQVCYLPQPSSNHVLTDTFAFNLLLGRAWPPSAGDLQEAGDVAESLGLGPLIEKMPAGMMQMVGEGGWRLSQGEQARLFLARGILQGARVLVVDELLAPLDPVTGVGVLKALEQMPSQLILIAHT